MNSFEDPEETFSQWEFELNKYERDNGQALPEFVKIAVILNETKGPLQQHLQLLAGQSPNYNQVRTTIMEYYRATTAFNKLRQQTSSSVSTNLGGGSAPMDISAIKGKGNGYKGQGKYKGKGKGKGKSYGGYKGKGKGNKGYGNVKGPVGQGNPFGYTGQPHQMNKGKGKGHKENTYKTFVTDVDNKDTLQSIAESQYTILEKYHKQQQNNMITPINGMKIHMPMMGIGGTIAWDSMDKTYSIRHNNLHYQHHKRQHQQTMHKQSRSSLEYIVRNQS